MPSRQKTLKPWFISLWHVGTFIFLFVCFFWSRVSLCESGLEFSVAQTDLNSLSFHLSFPSAGITSVHHHTQLSDWYNNEQLPTVHVPEPSLNSIESGCLLEPAFFQLPSWFFCADTWAIHWIPAWITLPDLVPVQPVSSCQHWYLLFSLLISLLSLAFCAPQYLILTVTSLILSYFQHSTKMS